MMLPSRPRAHLIVGQTAYTLAALEAFFSSLFGLRHSVIFARARLVCRVAAMVFFLNHLRLVAVTVAEPHQCLLIALLTPVGSRYYPSLHRFHHQRTFTAIAHIDPGPGLIIQRLAPGRDGLPGTLGPTPPAARCWGG